MFYHDQEYAQAVEKVFEIVQRAEQAVEQPISFTIVPLGDNEPTNVYFWLTNDQTETNSRTTYEMLIETNDPHLLVESLLAYALMQL